MAEGTIANWRHWPKPVQLSASLIGGAATLALVYGLVAGTPKPVLPSSALFEPPSIEQTLSYSRPELSSFDFIFRPVFALTRKPPVEPDLSSVDEAEPAAAETEVSLVESMDGVKLLGIFGSGEVEGAIVRLDSGEKRRLVTGEKLDGWELQSVSGRSIRLADRSGKVVDLKMVFSRSQQPFVEQGESTQTPRALGSRQAEGRADEGSIEQPMEAASDAGAFSFESMYRNRYYGEEGGEEKER